MSKNDADVAHYNFDADQPILIIFGRDVAERVSYQMMICYLTSPNSCLCITVKLVDECRRYSKPKQCCFRDTVYSMTEKTISGIMFMIPPGSAETFVRKVG